MTTLRLNQPSLADSVKILIIKYIFFLLVADPVQNLVGVKIIYIFGFTGESFFLFFFILFYFFFLSWVTFFLTKFGRGGFVVVFVLIWWVVKIIYIFGFTGESFFFLGLTIF